MTVATDVDLVFRALSDANRRAILRLVREEPRSVGDIADAAGLSQQTASHHLKVLSGAGLAERSEAGTRHLFVVSTDGLAAARSYLDDFWPSHLRALKAAAEAAAHADDDA